MSDSETSARERFTRDRFTWLAYFLLGYFAYTQAVLGPAMPFLRVELTLNYTVGGLHVTAFALGMVLAGLSGARAANRVGRRVLFWGGGGGMAAGAILLAVGRHPAVTIGGAFVMGLMGSFLMAMIQAMLSDHHGEQRATALTESNVTAAVGSGFAPLFVGLFAQTGIGWRAALLVASAAWTLATLAGSRTSLPAPLADPEMGHAAKKPLPRAFWLTWAMLVLMVAAEWCVIAWGADFMASSVGLERALASGLMTAFFVATIIGRFVGSRLTRRVASARLLAVALGVALAGFLIFWLATIPLLNVAGLFVAGLGIANLFPLGLAVATTLGGRQSDQASARVLLAAGVAILSAPQTLGAAADRVGIQSAYALVPVLLIVAACLLGVGRRLRA